MSDRFYLFVLFCCVLFIFISYCFTSDVFSYVDLIFSLLISMIGVVIFVKYSSKNVGNNFFKASYLFLLGFVIVHFQIYFEIILGNITISDFFLCITPTVINRSANLAALGLLFFVCGYIFYVPKLKNNLCNRQLPFTKKYPIWPLLLMQSLFLVLFLNYTDVSYFRGGYSGVTDRTSSLSFYSEILFRLLTYAILIVKSYYLKKHALKLGLWEYFKNLGWIFHINLIIFVILIALSGDRGPLITSAIIYAFAYIYASKRKLNFFFFIFVLFIASSVITAIGIFRQSRGNLTFIDAIQAIGETESSQSRSYDSISPTTFELASSIRTLHYSVKYIDDGNTSFHGQFQVKYLLSAIPFSNIITRNFFSNEAKYSGSSSFITWLDQGDFPSYGLGTCTIADLYLDSGLLGVIVGMFLLGMIIKYIDLITVQDNLSKSIFSLSLTFYTIGISVYLSRSAILSHFKGVLWLCIILYIYSYIFRRYAK